MQISKAKPREILEDALRLLTLLAGDAITSLWAKLRR